MSDRDRAGQDPWDRMGHQRCTVAVELLSALGRALGGEPRTDGGEELDELARRVFSRPAGPGAARVAALRDLLVDEPGFEVDPVTPEALLLDHVLAFRHGHPLLLSVVAAEAGRRAGLDTGVFSSAGSWYAGVRTEGRLWLIDTAGEPCPDPSPGEVRAHCAHTVAYGVLRGLEQRYAGSGRLDLARHASHLRAGLPVESEAPGGSGPFVELDDCRRRLTGGAPE